jgi:ATP synthase protein I
MTTDANSKASLPANTAAEQIGHRAARKLRSRKRGRRPIWHALGLYGLIGWSVATPAVGGAALGLWLDHKFDGRISWTVTLIFVGLALGCFNAWYWIQRESQDDEPHNEEDNHGDA